MKDTSKKNNKKKYTPQKNDSKDSITGNTHKDWNKYISTIISILAFCLSLVATIFSTIISNEQEIQASKRDFRVIIQRLIT